jgi:hypothetical protein
MRKPVGFDPNARNRRLASWFAPHVRRELELIAFHLDNLGTSDAELAGILTACLSAILYKVSSRSSDTDGTWVDRHVPRGAAARHFAQRIELLTSGLHDMSRSPGAPPDVFERDARRLGDVVPHGSACGSTSWRCATATSTPARSARAAASRTTPTPGPPGAPRSPTRSMRSRASSRRAARPPS